MKAFEAREKTIKANLELEKTQINNITLLISLASAKGECSISLTKPVLYSVIEHFKLLGYEVHYMILNHKSVLCIKW